MIKIAKIWMSFWRDFFAHLVSIDVQDVQKCLENGVFEQISLENWFLIPMCKDNLDPALFKESPIKANQASSVLKISLKSQNLIKKPTGNDVVGKKSSSTVKMFTEKDFMPSTFLNEECLLTYSLPANIGFTMMEYEWSIEGKFIVN